MPSRTPQSRREKIGISPDWTACARSPMATIMHQECPFPEWLAGGNAITSSGCECRS